MNNELVSVVIPTQNRSGFLKQAINSIDIQSYDNIEIIVIDDASDEVFTLPNKTPSGKVIKIFRNNVPLGGASSRNKGIDMSSGDYICFLDDDDLYHKNKIRLLLSESKRNNADVVFGSIVKFSDNFEPDIFCEEDNKVSILFDDFKKIHLLHTNTSLIRAECLKKVRFLDGLKKYQDVQLHLELIANYKVYRTSSVVAYWRQDHNVKRITDMRTDKDVMKTVNAYGYLFEYFLKNYNSNYSLIKFVQRTYLRICIKHKKYSLAKHDGLFLKYPFYTFLCYFFYLYKGV